MLLAMLKDLRKDMARKLRLQPWIIFSDPSLEDMTICYPLTLKELSEKCQGVGEGKANKFGKPFVTFIVLSVLAVGTAEVLHHVPGLGFFNTSDRLGTQILIAVGAFLIYAAVTALSLVRARKRFEKLDL